MDFGRELVGDGPLGFHPRWLGRLASATERRTFAMFRRVVGRPPYDALFARLARGLVGPYLYGLKVEVNTACMLRCPMCYVERTGQELPRAALDRLFRDLRGAGVRIELLGGEPLLRRDLAELVAQAKQVARAPFVSLYTNGLLADAERSAELGRAGLDAALVTLISARPEVHDRFVGERGAWQRTRQGIGNLMRAGIAVYTFTAVHRENLDEIPAIRRFVREVLGAHPTFYQYVPRSAADPLEVTPREWHAAKCEIIQASPEHMDFVRCFYLLTGNACSGGNFMLTVKADGTVQPCPFIADVPLGNIHEQDIFTLFRRRYRGTRLHELKRCPTACEPCAYRSVCAGGCRAAAGIREGRYDVPDHRCLGPFEPPLERERVLEHVPTFF